MSEVPDRQPNQKPGRLGQWAPVMIAVSAMVLYFLVNRPAPPLPGWQTDYATALSQAAASDRNVLIAFHLERCPPCEQMQRNVLNSDEIAELLEEFVPVRVDAAKERELANRFGVLGTPTYAVVNGDGTLLSRCEGYQPVSDFVSFLSRVSDSKSKPAMSAEADRSGGS